MKYISLLAIVFSLSVFAEERENTYDYNTRYGSESYDPKPVDGPYYSPNGTYIGQVYGGPTNGGYQSVPQVNTGCDYCSTNANVDSEGDE